MGGGVDDRYVLETVRWREGTVRILDQTRLPGAELYLELETALEVRSAILRLSVRGAPAIGVAGALGLALVSSGCRGAATSALGALRQEAEQMASVRPTAVNLRWACERIVVAAEACVRADPALAASDLHEIVLAEALHILEEDLALSRAMARAGLPLLPDEGRVLTHCNTGGLATAGGGTALGVVFEAVREGRRLFVHVDETRPLLQGARLTAWELDRAGIPYAVHCDGAAAWLMKTQKVDAVLVGADRVAANGDTANKIGTYGLALAAKAAGVPFYVVAPRSSFDVSLESGAAIPIEDRDAAEVLEWGAVRTAPEGARGWNPAFDVTPAEWITSWVTERGIEQPPFR